MPSSSTYWVLSEDTLPSIASRHGTTVEELVRINHIWEWDRIRPGQVLQLKSTDWHPPWGSRLSRSGMGRP